MPLLDQDPIDPEVAATLDAIDATLAGEPVDGRYADVAEIALLLASERPQTPPAFAHSLDQRVERRFASVPSERPRRRRLALPLLAGGRAACHRAGAAGCDRDRRGRWARVLVGCVVLSLVVLSLVVLSLVVLGSAAAIRCFERFGAAQEGLPARTSRTPAPQTLSPAPPASGSAKTAHSSPAFGSVGSAYGSAASSAASVPPSVQPPTTGRKVVQSAQLSLAAAPNQVDNVAQEIYNVIGQENGVVNSSTVTQTGGIGGYASFQLRVPSSALGDTMSRLSALNSAQVVSRTDSSQDITGQVGGAGRALADARALRTSLLKQLAAATTTEEIDSLKAQIRDAEASISSDQATLNRLNHQVDYSQLQVTVNARAVPAPASHGGGGFTLGHAAHDAGRVLMVAAGVALIALAALTPIALVVALAWWVGSTLKRRRRDQALDSV